MGIAEAAVVVYIRRLYFPDGVMFPIKAIDTDIAVVELFREVATMIMLITVGWLAGRTRSERFAWFIYCFGLWDLVYYAFLKFALGWPPSLLTWDLLFLLPVPWFGPVLAPCIVAATMCGIALTAVRFTDAGVDARMTMRERGVMIAGALTIILSFTIDWMKAEGAILWQNITMPRDLLFGMAYVPKDFPWWIFAIGYAMGLGAWWSYARRPRTTSATPREPSSDRSASRGAPVSASQ
jgi:hypothetical protein